MYLKKLFVTVLVLAGVYTQGRGMDTAALYQAIVDGNVEQLKNCIAKDAAFNPNGQYEVTGYRLADGRFFVPSAGVEGLSQKVVRGFSPLNDACQSNQLAVVRVLVEEYDAMVNEVANQSMPLRIASNNANVEMANYLISKGAKLHQTRIDELKSWAERNHNDPSARNIKRIVYALEGYKVVAGIPMTRLNVGLMVAGVAVCAVAGKYFYDRYCAAQKKSALDADEPDDVDMQGEANAVVTDQKPGRA